MSVTLTRPPLDGFGSPPPVTGSDDGGGGGGSGWTELVRAKDDIEAHLLAGRLGAADIEVQVVKDRSAPGAWLYGGANPWAPVVLMVRRRQLVDARVVLAEISYEAPEYSATEQRTDWRTPVVWWALALGLGVLMTGVALSRTPVVLERCDLPLVCGDTIDR